MNRYVPIRNISLSFCFGNRVSRFQLSVAISHFLTFNYWNHSYQPKNRKKYFWVYAAAKTNFALNPSGVSYLDTLKLMGFSSLVGRTATGQAPRSSRPLLKFSFQFQEAATCRINSQNLVEVNENKDKIVVKSTSRRVDWRRRHICWRILEFLRLWY